MTFVFGPNYPLLDLSEFLAGSLMLIFSFLVTLKINRGSKNYFAFTLMFFTAVLESDSSVLLSKRHLEKKSQLRTAPNMKRAFIGFLPARGY